MTEPRTEAGRALLIYYEESDGLPDWQRSEVVERILAIEREAATLDVERLFRAIERTSGFGRDIDYAARLAAEYSRLGESE